MLRRFLPFCLLALSACSGATPLEVPDDASTADVAPSGFTVSAAIAAASLADNCPTTASTGAAAPCAESDAGSGGLRDRACGAPFCRQTNLQITFTVTAAAGAPPVGPALPVNLASVRLLDAATNAPLDALTPREPQRWEGSQYVAWDAVLAAVGETRASFKLSAPDWTRIGGGNAWSTHGRAFRLEVTVVVNGQTLVLRSGELMRAPEVVT